MYHTDMKVRLTKWGNSLAIRIPKAFIAHLRLASGREIDMSIEDDRLILSQPQHTLRDLVEKITSENQHDLTQWGPPLGREVW